MSGFENGIMNKNHTKLQRSMLPFIFNLNVEYWSVGQTVRNMR